MKPTWSRKERDNMWTAFYLGVAFAALILYLPGYFFWRAVRFSPVMSLCCAPLYGVCAYAALPIAYYELGIPCSTVSVLGSAITVSLIASVLCRLHSKPEMPQLTPRQQGALRIGPLSIPFNAATIVLYVGIAAAVCSLVLIKNLPTPEAFANRFDNQTHLNLARAFVDSGKWSSLHASQWLASPANEKPITGSGAFYPAAWHCVTALICSATGLSVPAATSALLVVVQTLVFPLGELIFLSALFPENRRAIQFGAIAASAFSNWPWHFVVMGPLLPNILGLSILFAALGAVIIFIDEGFVSKMPLSLAILSAASLVATALSHPNTVFTAYVFMAFYGATVIDKAMHSSGISNRWLNALSRVIALCIYAAAIIAFWYAIYKVPALSSVINYGSGEATNPLKVIASIMALRFSFSRTQIGMSLACLCGLIALIRHPNRWRVLCPACFFALAYLSTRSGWGPVKYWTAALWYSDRRRLAINLTLFAMPIACLGLDHLASLTAEAFATASPAVTKGRHYAPTQANGPAHQPSVLGWILVVAIIIASFCPTIALPIGDGLTISTPLGGAASRVAERYATTNDHIYGADEIAFVNKVLETIPENALVINSPGDGSNWAYGAQGLNTMYRSISLSVESSTTGILMEKLSSYATDKEVQDTVKYTGAQYVLLLDKGVSYEDGLWLSQYTDWRRKQWVGIDSINDDTPGFEVVLAEGDEMRLYKIADAA